MALADTLEEEEEKEEEDDDDRKIKDPLVQRGIACSEEVWPDKHLWVELDPVGWDAWPIQPMR